MIIAVARPAAAQSILNDLFGVGSDRNLVRQGQPTQAEGGPTAPAPVGANAAQWPGGGATTESRELRKPQPFGASLFTGAVPATSDGANPNYVIQPGDRVSIRIWGGGDSDNSGEKTSLDASAGVVDPQGNVFVPGVGPIHIGGVRAGDLQSVVRREVSAVFTSNIQVYAVLVTSHRVGVFVTGFVIRPGRYAGAASDSPLDYLVRTGGVDPARGSYRDIVIERRDQVIARIDLYQFLLSGVMPTVLLQEDDTIIVGKQRAMVLVDGAARNDYLFEVLDNVAAGRAIIDLARPLPAATNAVVRGTRDNRPFALYVTLDELAKTPLYDQDQVTFVTDAPAATARVRIEGSRIGPSVLIADRDTRLPDLLNYVAVNPALADVKSIYLLRPGLAEQQQRAISEALDRLEKSLFLAVSSTTGVAEIRSSEAQLIASYIQRARRIKPEGRLVVANDDGSIANIRLEDNDVVVIPEKSQVVLVEGEVMAPQAILYQPKLTIADYVTRAGGFSERGTQEHFMIRRANGEILLDANAPLRSGDEIIILPRIDPKYFQLGRDFIQVLYEIALATRVFVP